MSDHFGNISISQPQQKKQPPRRPEKKKPTRPGRNITTPQTSSSGPWVILIACMIFLALFYAVCGFYLVPKLITNWVPEKVRLKTGTELSIERVEFNPFTFTLRCDHTTLVDPKSQKHVLFTFQSLKAKLAPISLLRGDFVTKHLEVDHAVFDIVHYKDSTYNFTPFIKSLQTSEHSDIMEFSELPFLFSLNNIKLSNSAILFKDIPNSASHKIEEIQLSLPNISNFPYQSSNYIKPSFSAKINGSPVELTSQSSYAPTANDVPQKTELSCNVDQLDLSLYLSYLPIEFPFTIQQGNASGILKLSFTPGAQKRKLLAEFSLDVLNLKLQNNDNLFTIESPAVKLEGGVQPVTGDTKIKQLVLREPVINIKPGHLPGILNQFLPKAEQDEQPPITPRKEPDVAIDLLIVDNGSLSVFSESVDKPLSHWEAVQFNLKNFSSTQAVSEKDKAQFRLTADKSDSPTTFNIHGSIQDDNTPSGEFRIDNIDAGSLFEWIGLASLEDSQGTADVTGQLGFQFQGENHHVPVKSLKVINIVFHDLTLHHKGEQWYSAPVTRVNGVSAISEKINLGNLFLTNCLLSLNVDHLPPIFSEIQQQDATTTFQAIDVKGNLILSKGSKGKAKSLQFSNLSLQAINPPKSQENTDRDNLTFKAELQTGSQIQAKGKFHFGPFSTVLSTAFTNLPAGKILPWFGNAPFLTEVTGALAGKGTFIYPEVSYNGQLVLKNGRFGDKTNPYLTWDELELQDSRINRKPFYLGGSELILNGPRFIYTRGVGTTHPVTSLIRFIDKQFPKSKDKKAQSVTLSSVELQKFSINDGTIFYQENRITPAWESEISYFRGHMNSIIRKNGGMTASPFSFSGNLDTIPFTLEGTINPFDLTDSGNSLFNMKEYPLPSFHQQLSGKLDIDSSQGELSITNRSDWNNGIVNEQNQLVFSNVRPESATANSALTLALLSESNNNFELKVDTKHKLTESTEPLINKSLTTFGKLMVKSAVSPFLVATGDYSDLAGNERARFMPGQITLSGQGKESLTRFSSLLSSHPDLGIIVTGCADRDIDGKALHEQLEQAEMERVALENDKRRRAYEETREKYIEQQQFVQDGSTDQIVEKDIPPELLKPFIPVEPEPVVIDDAMLKNLANERARVIFSFFTEQLALEQNRITIIEQPVIIENSSEIGNQVLFKLFSVAAESN